MDIRTVKALLTLVTQHETISEIEINAEGETVRISQHPKYAPTSAASIAAPAVIPSTASTAAPAPSEAAHAAPVEAALAAGHKVLSPMVGTLYRASSPGAKSFVELGQSVKTGEVLCIIEAMKMMNQIESDQTGTIVAVLVENGQAVEYGQPLFIIN